MTRRLVLPLAAVLAMGVAVSVHSQAARGAQQSRMVKSYDSGQWTVDVDGDTLLDSCRAVSGQQGYRIACTLTGPKYSFESQVLDLGYPEGRAWVDFNGDGRQDFCRVVGDGYQNNRAVCNLSAGKSLGKEIYSDKLDWGYPETRKWTDANGDRLVDFCRTTGSYREYWSCTFSAGTAFGRTVTSKR